MQSTEVDGSINEALNAVTNKQPGLVNCGREMQRLRERMLWTVKGLTVLTLCFLIE